MKKRKLSNVQSKRCALEWGKEAERLMNHKVQTKVQPNVIAMITTTTYKRGVVVHDDTKTKGGFTIKAGAKLGVVKQSLSPALRVVRQNNATELPDGTALLNNDVVLDSLSQVVCLLQGASTSAKAYDRNIVSSTQSVAQPNGTTNTAQQQPKQAKQKQVNPANFGDAEKEALYEDIVCFMKDFNYDIDPRQMNILPMVNNKPQHILCCLDLLGAPDDIIEEAQEHFKSPEWKNIDAFLKMVKPSKQINQRLEIYYGKPGTGKTYKVMNELYPNATIISAIATQDPNDLFFVFNGQTMKQDIPTELTKAMMNGTPLIIDEAGLYSNEVWTTLQAILDNKDKITDHGNEIAIKDGFKLVITMNNKTNAGRIILPEPIVSRISKVENFDKVPYSKLAKVAWN